MTLTMQPDAIGGDLDIRFGQGAGIVDTGLATEDSDRWFRWTFADLEGDLGRIPQLGELRLATIGLAR